MRGRGLESRGSAWAVSVGLAALAAAISWSRLPAAVRGTVWAEDGQRFLEQRLELGPWASLLAALDGSQHFVPRVLTDVAVLVAPLDRYAVVVTALSCLTAGLAAGRRILTGTLSAE